MSFRKVPKRSLVLQVPEDVYQRLRKIVYEDGRDYCRSEHASKALARGLGLEPDWMAADDKPASA